MSGSLRSAGDSRSRALKQCVKERETRRAAAAAAVEAATGVVESEASARRGRASQRRSFWLAFVAEQFGNVVSRKYI